MFPHIYKFRFFSKGNAYKCYVCTEYVNENDDQAPVTRSQSTNMTIGSRKLDTLCHGFAENYKNQTLVDCPGDCVKAVTKSMLQIF